MISSLTSGHPMWICSLGGNSEDEFGASAECSDPTFSDAPADSEDLLSLRDEAEPEFNVSFNNPASLGPDSPDFWSADSEEELQLLRDWRPSLPETEKRIWNFDLAESREEEVEATPPPPADSQLPTHTRKRKSPSEEEPLPKIVSDASTKSSISSIPHHPTNPDSLRGAIDNNWSPLEQTQQPLPQPTVLLSPTNTQEIARSPNEIQQAEIQNIVAQLVEEKIGTGKRLETGQVDEALDLLERKGITITRKAIIARVHIQYKQFLEDLSTYTPITSKFGLPTLHFPCSPRRPQHPTDPDSLRGAVDNNWSPLEQTQQPLPQSTFPPPPTNIGGKTKFSKEMIDHVVAQLVDEKIKTGKKLEPGRADEAVDLLAQKGIKTTRKCLITRVYNQYRKCLKDPGKYIPIISEFEAPLSSLLPPGCPQRS